MQALLDAGADPCLTDNEGCTPLHQALRLADHPLFQTLHAAAGAKAAVVDRRGTLALPHSSIGQTRRLRAQNSCLTDSEGCTPLDQALRLANHRLFQALCVLMLRAERLRTLRTRPPDSQGMGSFSGTSVHITLQRTHIETYTRTVPGAIDPGMSGSGCRRPAVFDGPPCKSGKGQCAAAGPR